MIIQSFDNILAEELFISSSLNDFSQEKINLIACKRFYFSGAGSNSAKYDKLFEDCYAELYNLLFKDYTGNRYQIQIEDSKKQRNRIRSHKGLFSETAISKEDFISIEEDLDNNSTIIAGIIALSENNYLSCIDLIGNSRTGFVLCSGKDYFSKDSIKEILKYRNDKTHTSLNYQKLIVDYCLKGDFICKITGDGGDTYLAIDWFYRKQ